MSLGNSTVSSQNLSIQCLLSYIFFPKIVGLWLDLIVNPFWKLDLDLDYKSHNCDGFGLDWQSKKIRLSNSLYTSSTLLWPQVRPHWQKNLIGFINYFCPDMYMFQCYWLFYVKQSVRCFASHILLNCQQQ